MQRLSQPLAHIRRLWPSDAAAYRDHLLRLDSKGRYNRFASIMPDEAVVRHASKCFGPDCLVYGYFVDEDLRAAAELHVLEPGTARFTGEAEAAFSVEKNWRRKGVGGALMERVNRAARNRGLHRVVITCLQENQAMQGLARKFGAKFDCRYGEVAGRVIVHLPTARSFFGEMVDDSFGFATAVLELQKRIFHPARDQAKQTTAA